LKCLLAQDGVFPFKKAAKLNHATKPCYRNLGVYGALTVTYADSIGLQEAEAAHENAQC
jgi:hypothetical protein